MKFLTSFYVLVISLSFGVSLNAAQTENVVQPIVKSKLGSVQQVYRQGDLLYLSGQINQNDLEFVKAKSFDRVISLRSAGEISWNEEQAVRDAGIEFVRVPLFVPETFTDLAFSRIRELLADHSKKTLLHCDWANSTAAVWLPYRVIDQGVNLETAIQEAKHIGLVTPGFLEKAVSYIGYIQDNEPRAIERAALGKAKNVHRESENLYFAGQFTPADIELLKSQSFQRVITLRTDGEIDWQEEKMVKDAGMEFIKVPFRAPETMTDEVIEKVRKLLSDRDQKTLFHCGSANRVGGVWIPFRVLDQGVELETAMKEAREIGLRTTGYLDMAVDYVKRKQSDPGPGKIEKASLGKTKNVHREGDKLYFAGQFTKEDLKQIKSESFTRVITLRTDGEIDWDEEKAVTDAGIEFIKVPFRGPDTLTDDVFEQIRDLLRDDSKKTLFHCGSANRVGGVWIPFRVLDQGIELETAIKEAKEIGLRNEGYLKRAQEYLKKKVDDTEEESVKPGINDSFKSSKLNVDDFINRFEVESREVYTARKAILDATGISSGTRVADVGAGTGLFTRLFEQEVGQGGWVFAVDISPKFLEHISNESAKSGSTNVTPVFCTDKSVCLPNSSVDSVFVCDTYHHFEYPARTLNSIYKALVPGGTFVIVDFEKIPGVTRPWLMNHVRADKQTVRAEIQDAGFDFVEEVKVEGLKENYLLIFKRPE